ncbi:uncharacterized protein C8Q71DRAFT_851719 [Rhodofomes roseus]|uniref:DUF6532 domain-containing protein n=1 Tax=Rhodofomes roseus TaxID=34475 RepID=A0ABQ8JZH1_9APHY|nr:uncharacterized protein C8Q71DRAFT_851719 [Rhodofomes roseus]KAH9829486.1 hypothetical protein C8Q71DRAFT_851719 [Rhodofomes roseus]
MHRFRAKLHMVGRYRMQGWRCKIDGDTTGSQDKDVQPASRKVGRDAITTQRALLSASGNEKQKGRASTAAGSGKGKAAATGASGGTKRKAPADSEDGSTTTPVSKPRAQATRPAKKAKTKAPAGIQSGWTPPTGSRPAASATPKKAIAREWSKMQPPQDSESTMSNQAHEGNPGLPGEVRRGGFASDDDDEAAAPEPGDVRTTAMGIVSITHAPSKDSVAKGRKREKSIRYKNEDLPSGCLARWRNTYVPTMYDMYATGSDPWANNANDSMIGNLNHIWKRVYGDPPASAEDIAGPILGVMIQRLAEWRNKFASTATEVVQQFFDDAGEQYASPESRADYVKYALGPKKPFIWQTTTPKRRGAFQSQFVLETFASHLTETHGTMDKYYMMYEPQGALALACVALERAFTLFESGVRYQPDRQDPTWHFKTDKWNDATESYLLSIAQLKLEDWDAIVVGAEPYAKKGKARRRKVSASSDCDMGPEDDRARLLDSSDSESESDKGTGVRQSSLADDLGELDANHPGGSDDEQLDGTAGNFGTSDPLEVDGVDDSDGEPDTGGSPQALNSDDANKDEYDDDGGD